MHAVIVGAGIGGLSAAVGLHRAGWTVTVLERARSADPLGTCIALAPNALRALDSIGIGERFREFGITGGRGGIRSPDGRWRSVVSAAAVAERFGEPLVVTRRGRLADVLLSALPSAAVRTGVRVRGVYGDTVHTTAGAYTADLVVGADGVRSAVRGSLFPWYAGVRGSGTTAWRFVVRSPGLDYPGSETWGRGEYFGIVPLAGEEWYCFAAAPSPAEDGALRRRFGSWHEPIPTLLEAAGDAAVYTNELCSLRPLPPRFHHGRAVLLGDAAHAMLPNLGQGGCQAIEDAATLAALLAGHRDVPAALDRYTALRTPRTAAVARASAAVSAAAGLRSPVAVRARDAALSATRLLPERVLLRGMAGMLDWTPAG